MTPALAVVRECRGYLSTAITNASYVTAISMTSVRVRSAKQGISHEYESYIGYCRDFSGLLGGGCGGHKGVRLIGDKPAFWFN